MQSNLGASARLRFPLVAAITLLGATLAAQCTPQWVLGGPVAGTDMDVNAMTEWDPDGPGPATPVLVLAGSFNVVGSIVSPLIATWDPATGQWGTLGNLAPGGTNIHVSRTVTSLAVLPNGQLVAAGLGLQAQGGTPTMIAAWNGTVWVSLGAPYVNGSIMAMCVDGTGNLVVGGAFGGVGGVPARNLARWNGSTWSPLGYTNVNGWVSSLMTRSNGNVVAGGGFTQIFMQIGGPPTVVNRIAEWNGSTWSALGTGIGTGAVYSLAELANGDVVAGGTFAAAGGVACNCIARWNGTAWAPLGAGLAGRIPMSRPDVFSLRRLANGDLLAGGNFTTAGGVAAPAIARWNGTAWSGVNGGIDGTVAVVAELANGSLWCGGSFQSTPLGGTASNIAVASGAAWIAPTTGTSAHVFAIHRRPNGDIVVGGAIGAVQGVPARGVASFSNGAWSALGSGLDGTVRAFASLPGGDLVAGGQFTTAGGAPVNRLASWNGTSWAPLGGGADEAVSALAVLANGDLIAGGSFTRIGGVAANRIARWNGVAWSPLGTAGANGVQGQVLSLRVATNGDLLVGGDFELAGGLASPGVARWNGTSWLPVGPGLNVRVFSVVELAGGVLVATGIFGQPFNFAHTARWSGTTWVNVFGNDVGTGHALAALPDGSFVVGGALGVGDPATSTGIVRWTAGGWTPFGSGINNTVWALERTPDGELWVGGEFSAVDGQVSAGIARLRSPCPAVANVAGQGCSGAAGPVAMQATSLPWLGGTFAATTSGVPANAIALTIWGFGTLSIPLVNLLPQGAPGCSLLATPDVLALALPANGAVATSLAIPSSIALVGAQLFHQVAPVELGAAGAITAITSSNALALTIGAF